MTEKEIKKEFASRKADQRIGSYSALAAGAGAWALGRIVPCFIRDILYVIATIYVLTVLWRTYKNWRCPACGKLLGRRIDIDACPHCRTKLT